MATSLEISKRGPDRSSTTKKLSFDAKFAKIGPADLQIICVREIIKKDFKKEKKIEITDCKIYSPFGNFCQAG